MVLSETYGAKSRTRCRACSASRAFLLLSRVLRYGECYHFHFRNVSEARSHDKRISIDVFSIPVGVHERCAPDNCGRRRTRQRFSRWIIDNWPGRRCALRSCHPIHLDAGSVSRTASSRPDSLKSPRVSIATVSV